MPETIIGHGSGSPAVVFTHGFGGSGADWAAVADAVSTETTVVLWDLPGHGDAPPAANGAYTLETGLDALAEVIDGVGGSAVLVGHSLGGYLSMTHYLDRPDSVLGLVLVATGPGYRDPEARRRWNEMVTEAEDAFDVAPGSAGLVRQNDSRVIDALATITVPTLLIVGERDRRFHAAHDLLAAKTGARSVTIAGAGHHVQRTHADDVAPLIIDFLRHSPSNDTAASYDTASPARPDQGAPARFERSSTPSRPVSPTKSAHS